MFLAFTFILSYCLKIFPLFLCSLALVITMNVSQATLHSDLIHFL